MVWTNLNLEDHLKQFPPSNIKNFHIDNLKYILGLIAYTGVIDDYVLSEDFSSAALGGRISHVPYMIGSTKDDPEILGSGDEIAKFCIFREELDGKAYAYQFARPLPGDESGAFHSSELWYTFHTLKRSWRPFTEGDYDLSNVMVDA